MATLTQKRRRLKFWFWSATLAMFAITVAMGLFAWVAEPGSSMRRVFTAISVINLVLFPLGLLRVYLQLKEIERTGDVELLDDAYREHVVDKGGYVHKQQVKTWMWVVPLALILLIALGLALLVIYDLYFRDYVY